MNKKALITSLFLAPLLSGCSLAPKYSKPSPEISKNWSQNLLSDQIQDFDKKSQNDLTKISWQNFFKNKELKNAIELALKNNRDLKLAALNAKAAQEFYNIKKSENYPKINLDANFSRIKITKNSTNFGFSGRSILQNQYSVGPSASFELDFFGKLKNVKKSALNEFFAKKEAENIVKISLISQVANIYIESSYLKKQLEILQNSIDVNEKIYQLQKERFKRGIISKSTLLQNKKSLEEIKTSALNIKNLLQQNKNQLLLLTAQNDEKIIKIIDFDKIELASSSFNNLNSEILLARPDIAEKEYELKAKNANIGAARANLFPSVSLTGSYGYASANFSNLFSSGSKGSWLFAPSVSLPIFQGGANFANLRISKVEKEIAVEQYQKTIQNAFKEVADQLSAKKYLDEELSLQNQILNESKEINKISQSRVKSGLDNYFQVAESEIALNNAQISYIFTRKLNLSSKINLYKSLGGGLQ